jgi:hypothetical protein
VLLKYTLQTINDRKPSSFDQYGGHPILSSDYFIFSGTITSKIFGKQRATAVHTYYIITSEMIFIVFSAKFFQAIFEK